MATMHLGALVAPSTLAAYLDDERLKIFDASWHMPASERNGLAEYEKEHIPGAIFFDIDAIADRSSDLPHMLPDEETFASTMMAAGVNNDSHVVVYDSHGLMSAARVWWMMRAFGHSAVSVLDGGLPAWRADGLPLTEEVATPRTADSFTACLEPALVRSKAQIAKNISLKREQVVDARSAGRFLGSAPEPRPGISSGHVPGSINVPFTSLLSDDSLRLKTPEELAAIFTAAGVDVMRPVIASCGSGVTACVLALALHVAGFPDAAVYDGSWAEWAADPDSPIKKN